VDQAEDSFVHLYAVDRYCQRDFALLEGDRYLMIELRIVRTACPVADILALMRGPSGKANIH
jgi:hypothetical protein